MGLTSNSCDMASSDAKKFSFRITGPQSIDRLDPLIKSISDFNWACPNDSVSSLDFVWETSCKLTQRNQHLQSIVLNRLHNSQIIEDKSNFAFLQYKSVSSDSSNVLETYVADNHINVAKWFHTRWATCDDTRNTSALLQEPEATPTAFAAAARDCIHSNRTVVNNRIDDWWVVKASKGNGGRDIWILHVDNFRDALPDLPPNEEYVIQRYVKDPMLWNGYKFHFRMYAILRGDMSTFVYEKGFVLTAGLKYDCNTDDVNKHITNLSINKKLPGHPGQIPINVKGTHPAIFEGVRCLWGSLMTAAKPFLCCQRSAHHFEFFGLDVICDSAGKCWLIEVNRLPGLESSLINTEQEDQLYDEMMLSLLQIVLEPLLPHTADDPVPPTIPSGTPHTTSGYPIHPPPIPSSPHEPEEQLQVLPKGRGFWNLVHGPSSVKFGSKDLWKNLLNWRAFTRKNRSKIVV